jgi:hypothetical protein
MAAQVTGFETDALVVASGQTTSGALLIKDPASIGLIVPTITSGTVTVQVSADGTNWFGLKDTGGNALLSYAASTGGFACSADDLAPVLGYAYLRLVCGASQGADRTFTVCRTLVRTDPLA